MKSGISMILGVFVVLISMQALAQTSGVSINSVNQMREVIKKQELADPQIITDKKLQADEGSRSKYSLKFGLSYSGPGLGDLGNKNQPNPDGVISTNQTKISGSIGGRYRIDGISAVSVGTGISAIYPMHGWERTDVNNPFVSYDRSSRRNDLQIRNILSASGITTPEYKKVGEVAAASYEIDLVHGIGDSRYSVGFDTKFEYFFYNRDYKKSDKKAAQNYLSFYPNLKYQFSDKLNVNTSFSVQFYNARMSDDRYSLWNRTVTERIGLGYSYRRDVYLSPYITIYPQNINAKNSTFNLAATFSIL